LVKVSIIPQISRKLVRSAELTPLFPSTAVVVERRLPGDPADLLPDEAHYVARARPKRLQEFAAGRACARLALAEFGVHQFALRAADDRQPIWPDGFVGSITHTTDLCVAAVARRSDILALGVDSELIGAPTPDIWTTICRAEELAWVEALPPEARPAAITLIFSAKEAFYKCQYPLVAEWLDFHDLSIRVVQRRAGGVFTVIPQRTLLVDRHMVAPVEGRFLLHEKFVSAAVTIPAGTRSQ
jgi:4'-phosphopantetheinyl transferase EntD